MHALHEYFFSDLFCIVKKQRNLENAEMVSFIEPRTRKYMHAETLALLTKPVYFPNMKYLN